MSDLSPVESTQRNYLKDKKPLVYEKILKYEEKFKRGESIAIMHMQYDYVCNFTCQHCSIHEIQGTKGTRTITPKDIRNLSDQAHALGLARWVITGGEPLVFKELDAIVEAIDPSKFYINMDSNGWFLDEEKAQHLKDIGIDRVQLSLDSLNADEHDDFRRKTGSHARALQALDACLKVGLGIIVLTVVTKQRLHSQEFIDFLKFVNGKGVGVFVTYAKPIGAWEGYYDGLVDQEDMAFMRELEKQYKVFTHLTPAYGIDMGCIAGKGMITFTKFGDVLACQYMFISIGNIFHDTLKEVIDRALSIKWFGEYIDNCPIAADREFIEKYIAKGTYGKTLPVPYTDVFTDEDKTKIPFHLHKKA